MISAPFAATLAAGRPAFNQRVVEARRRHAGLNTDAFSDFLETCVDPVIAAVFLADPDCVPAATHAAYDLALELAGLRLIGEGARSTLLPTVWQTLAPKYARLIAKQSGEVLGLLSNAALYLESVPGARCATWLGAMAAVSSQVVSMEQLQAAGQIVAWRSGVAHFRHGAIEAADRLPESLALAALGANGDGAWPQVRARLLADPWWTPGAAAPLQIDVGDFTGFGGQFGVPPEVHAHPHGFTVRAGALYYLLIADAWGAVLHPSDALEHDRQDAAKGDWKLRDTTLQVGGRQIILDLPPDGIRVCCNGPTLAITSPYTHAIRLVPAR